MSGKKGNEIEKDRPEREEYKKIEYIGLRSNREKWHQV